MAQLINSDLLIVGRGSQSFKLSYSAFKTEILNGTSLPDTDNNSNQPNTLDDRYLKLTGGTLTGGLILPDGDPASELSAVTKAYVDGAIEAIDILPDLDADKVAGTLDDRYVMTKGDTIVGDLILQKTIDEDTPDKAAVSKEFVVGEVSALSDTITALSTTVSESVASINESIDEVNSDLTQEINRAQEAETALGERVDDLELGDLADVNTLGAESGQVLSYDGSTYVPRTIVLSSTLEFQGEIDLTSTPPTTRPGGGEIQDGDLFVNTATSGTVDSGFPAALASAVPTVNGGEFVAVSGGEFVFVGNIGGGLTYQSFDAVTADASGGGELAYNKDTGVFTFAPADLSTRIPTDLSSLGALPTIP